MSDAAADRREPVTITKLELHAALLIRGRGLAAYCTSIDLPLPAPLFGITAYGERLVARTGSTEGWVDFGSDRAARDRLAEQIEQDDLQIYTSRFAEASFSWTGPASEALLRRSCAADAEELGTGRAHFVQLAGVSAMLVIEGGEESVYRCWTDPSLGDYLRDSLRRGIDELNTHTPRRC
ncbi:MAG: hypothetical protein AAGB29_09400 [Planctomycetota bacterium]